jgi:hypothetical protein
VGVGWRLRAEARQLTLDAPEDVQARLADRNRGAPPSGGAPRVAAGSGLLAESE